MYGEKKLVALCCSKINDAEMVEMVAALNEQLRSYGYHLVVFHTCSDLYWKTLYEVGERAVFSLMDYKIIDAVVILERAFYDKDLVEQIAADASDAGVPVVCIGDKIKNCIHFRKDNGEAFRMVVRHMLEEHSAERILMVAGIKGEKDSEERLSVFREELAKHNLPCNEELIIYGDYWSEPTKTSLEAVLQKGIKFDTVICANDSMAVSVCDVLHKYGFRLPEDVRISGFDGSEQAYYNRPMLTTAGYNMKAVMRKVGCVIHQVLQGNIVEDEYVIPGELIVSQSCGCEIKVREHRFSIREKDDLFYQYMHEDRLLQEMISRIQLCESPREFAGEFKGYQFKDTMVMVNHSFFDESINPVEEENELVDEQMYILSDEIPADCSGILPKLSTMKETMDEQFRRCGTNPMVLSTLSYNGVPFGLMIFYKKATMQEYVRIPQQIQVFNNALSVYRMVRHMSYMTKSMEEASKRDAMTGLYNRNGFYAELSALEKSLLKSRSVGVAICDLDGLKYINDHFGHDNGDGIIKALAEVVAGIPIQGKICARFGGDEFVLCFPIYDEENIEKKIRDYLQESFQEYNEKMQGDFQLSASIGICVVSGENFQFDEVLKLADERMYKEKMTKPHHR